MPIIRPVGITEFEDCNWEIEETYWWFAGRRRIIAEMLRHCLQPSSQRRALDIGCGPGVTMQSLAEFGNLVGVDQSRLALTWARERGHRHLLYGDGCRLPFRSGAFELVTLLDVLEHIPDDRGALAEIRRVLCPGGLLLLTVPAHRFLWSEHDEALQHCRRYVAGELERRLRGAGYCLDRLTYAITVLAPVIVAFRLWQRRRPRRDQPRAAIFELPGWINRLCESTLIWESRWLRRHDLPYGITVLALARKP